LNSQLANAKSKTHRINVYENLDNVYFLKPVSSNMLILTGIEKYRSATDGIRQKADSPNQFVENVVVEDDVFTGAVAFDVFHEIGN
jgi:hypothetical protein